MNFQEVIRLALRALSRNKMRTLLTMLGIIIGVGAVICTVAIGQGAGNQVQAQIQNLGTNLVMVFAGSVNTGGVRMGSQATKTLTDDDAQAILQHVPNITAVSPSVTAAVQVVNAGQNWATRIQGVSAEYLDLRSWPLVEGSNFSTRDVEDAGDVCDHRQNRRHAIVRRRRSRWRNRPRLKICLFACSGCSKPRARTRSARIRTIRFLLLTPPCRKKFPASVGCNMINAGVDSQADMPTAQKQIASLLRQRHHLRPTEDDDFIIRSPDELAQTADATRAFSLFCSAVSLPFPCSWAASAS